MKPLPSQPLYARWGLSGALALIIAVATVVSGTATYALLSSGTDIDPDSRLLEGLLYSNVLLVMILVGLVGFRVMRLWRERRAGSAGSKLHVRIVMLFSMVAVTPAIVMAVFSALFFYLGLESWFSSRVQTAVRESVAVAEAYFDEHRKTISADVLAMAADVNRNAAELRGNAFLFNQIINVQSRLRVLSEAVVFNSSGQVIAVSGFGSFMNIERIPEWAMQRAMDGEVAVLTSDTDDRVRALVRLDGLLDSFLYVGRLVDPKVIDHAERARSAAEEYETMALTRSNIEATFAILFVLVSLLVLLAAIWFGLSLATQLVRPVRQMAGAAERLRLGDYDVRVEEPSRDDEIALLGRAFNRMSSQLSAQRRELIDANQKLDERRRFTEAVLSGVSAGVIGTDAEGRITLPNPSALALLNSDADAVQGRSIEEVLPEIAPLFRACRDAAGQESSQGQVTLYRGGKVRTLQVRVTSETDREENVGYVITFDDISDLLAAQRTAAWADVARRIAHEIKNPLTPIQLSAERLRRKYKAEITSDPDIFDKCTDTIIRQVGDIGRMVDEFSAFARMPAPVFRPENLIELTRQAVFLQHVAHPEIFYAQDLPDAPVWLKCDGRQVMQVMTNILQNAADAIEGQGERIAAPKITVRLRADAQQGVEIAIIDNGPGLPSENRERLTEPYVTGRVKGTGLGLAIVKKIMEEHRGHLSLEDAPQSQGAMIVLTFPAASILETPPDDANDARIEVGYGA